MSHPKARISIHEKDRGLERILAMGKRVAADRPYAKAGIVGAKAGARRATELDRANHAAAREAAHMAGEKAPKLSKSGISNVELAIIHEFGAPSAGIPERSFIRAPFAAQQSKYETMARTLVRKLYELEMDERQALGILGLAMATDMKNYITQGTGVPPPNSPAVMRRKAAKGRAINGADPRTLVDTGQLLGAITWQVVMKDESTEPVAGGGE